jgi:glycosyltransferase involved in cell wall biosynthesis
MRILTVTNLFPNPLQPGRGIFNWRQLRLLSQRDELRVLSPVLWTEELTRVIKQRRPFFANRTWQQWEGMDVAWCRYYYTPLILRHLYGRFLEWSIRSVFRTTVETFRPDLVYVSWPYPDGWAVCRLAHEVGLPVVVKVHGSDLFLLDRFYERKSGTVEVMRSADAIIGVGRALCDAAINLGAASHRCFLVPEGTDKNVFSPGEQAEARVELGLPLSGPRILFVGNLVAVKRVNDLIDACERLIESGLRVEADIIGDGPLLAMLKRQVRDAGLTGSVHFRGHRNQSQLPAWYRAADVFVLPSDSEGLPNVLIEAAACGTPFVATAVGCIPEITHFVRSELVPPGNPSALARSIRTLLTGSRQTPNGADPERIPSVMDGVNATAAVFRRVLEARSGTTAR